MLDKLANKISKVKEQFEAGRQAIWDTMPPHIAQDRMKICNDCEHLYKPTSTCKRCGCFMTLKTKMPNQKCPINKWLPYNPPKPQE